MSARDSYASETEGVLRFLTAGSVDDGKSTLIGRLLYDSKTILADQLAAVTRSSQRRGAELDFSLFTDGLTAEREQGITIDVAYRYFATGRRKFIIADAPGHEQYTRNMVTAASTAELAVLLVDARNGIVTQTRRHATLAHLLGIRQIVVAINKMDLVDFREQVFARVVADFQAFTLQAGIASARLHYVPLSALEGDMIVERGSRMPWYDGPTLLEILETAPTGGRVGATSFRFPVQFVSRAVGMAGRAYLGRVEAGAIAVGDRVAVLPAGRTTTIRSITTFDGPRTTARLHDAITVTLADDVDVARGDMLAAADDTPAATRDIGATLCWLDERPLDLRRTYLLRHTAREVRVRVERLAHRVNVNTTAREPADTLATNDIGQATLALAQPVACDRYDDNAATGSFILIDETTNATVAAGMIR